MKVRTLFSVICKVGFCCLVLMLPYVVGCAAPPEKGKEPVGTKAELTYYKDIKPLLNRNCVSCHQKGGIGPIQLDTYEKVNVFKDAIAHAVRTRRMPPWQPADNCQEYVGDSSLAASEIKTITDWVGQGAKKGDSSQDKASPPDSPVGISRKDVTVTMKPFDQYKMPDDYRCFVMDWPLKEKAYVTGLQVDPGNRMVAHHAIVVIAGPSELDKIAKLEAQDETPGYSCFGSPGQGLQTVNVGSWVPGAQQRDYPDGSGILVEPGSKVIVQMHYNVYSKDAKPDQTSVSFKIDKEVEKIFKTLPITNPQWVIGRAMKIPAGEADVTHTFSFDPAVGFAGRKFTDGKEVLLHSATIHMHQRGKSGKIWIKHEDGTQTCLLNIPRWDFNWQGRYRFTKPILFKPGDEIAIECKWDNSAANQPIVDGKRLEPAALNWGDGTQDEMCLGAVTFVDK